MAGVLLLLALTVVMALASFLAGALPLSMSLSQSQLRLISSIGIGILVGTSLIVIVPEGVSAISEASLLSGRSGDGVKRGLLPRRDTATVRWASGEAHAVVAREDTATLKNTLPVILPDVEAITNAATHVRVAAPDEDPPTNTPSEHIHPPPEAVPTFYVGLSLILGFILMFLVDRLPRHASENFQPPPAPRHISLSNLGGSALSADEEESEGFLGSLTPTPKQTRSLATTTGLVIHAAADGIAMGASAASSDMKLGFIIFIAIMVHKAPAAFGLTSILLKQGLSKRAARGHLIVFSLASPFGAWATFIMVNLVGGGGTEGESEFNQWWTGMLLLFSAGTFLYVAMHAMQEGDSVSPHETGQGANGYADSPSLGQRKQSRPQMRDTIATVVGMLLPLLTQFSHHH
ncbi:ZIP metal ion transporter-like protein [Xylariales sp. AK1849]|nr:ZIP metal ion transporter-like protein [Xylariales sp. AK1849]